MPTEPEIPGSAGDGDPPSEAPGRRRRGRPRKQEQGAEPPAYIRWIRGRAYAELRAWKAWGGGQEGLVAEGEKFATEDEHTATILFGERLAALRKLRQQHPKGLPKDDREQIARFVGYHIARLRTRQGRKPIGEAHLSLLRSRLKVAALFFDRLERTYLREITAQDVAAYAEYLRTTPFPRGKTGHRKVILTSTSQRRYLDALGGMLQRAVGEGRIVKNWVREMADKPTVAPSPTEHLELGEGALLLEAARRLFPPEEKGRPIYALLGFYLLTGVIESERAGVELADVHMPGDPIYPRGVVIIRPNRSRTELKTIYRDRIIPMHPQLAEILEEYLTGPNKPAGPLLFPEPGSNGKAPIGDWRKSVDRIAAACGYAPGEIRTRRFRVTYATHRLSTLDTDGHPMTAWKLRGEMGHGTEQMIEQRYGRYAKHRARRPVLEYRWAEWEHEYGRRLNPPAVQLTEGQRRTLALLAGHAEGLTSREWQTATGDNPGTFFPRRERLTALDLVWRDGTKRGSRFRVTEAGHAALRE